MTDKPEGLSKIVQKLMRVWKLSIIHCEDKLDGVHIALVMYSQSLETFRWHNKLMRIWKLCECSNFNIVARLASAYMWMPIDRGGNVDDWMAIEIHLLHRSNHA